LNESSRKEPEGERPLEKSRPILEDNIKMDLKDTGCEDVGFISLSFDRIF
jgi:hypothetical protein